MDSLILKYRPITFEEVIGQEINIRFLSNLIKRGQIGKNIIFHGPFGSGKTSMGRIYARVLNCKEPSREGSPCNKCDSCLSFFNKEYSDYLEIDGSFQGGKEQLKDILEISKSKPLFGKYRVLNIEECHNLSKSAWDTLLNLTEEPSSYLVYILSTTEYIKIPETIKSRCHCREVKLLDYKTSKEYLKNICKLENLLYEEKALDILTYISRGHPRDMIKNLEQVSYFGDINLENVILVFDLNYIQDLMFIFESLFSRNGIDSILQNELLKLRPLDIFKGLQSFILEIYYISRGLNLEINPLLKKDFKDRIYLKIIETFNKKDISLFLDGILNKFKNIVINSQIEISIFLINLYTFIHEDIKEIEIPLKKKSEYSSNISSCNRRKFVEGFENKILKIEDKKEIILDIKSLSKYGFKFKNKSELNIKDFK